MRRFSDQEVSDENAGHDEGRVGAEKPADTRGSTASGSRHSSSSKTAASGKEKPAEPPPATTSTAKTGGRKIRTTL